jgi:hypothetical protein
MQAIWLSLNVLLPLVSCQSDVKSALLVVDMQVS